MGGYINLAMKQFISDHEMLRQTSCLDTPQQNGVAERKNRTLLEITRALLIESHTPASFWPEAVATTTYLTSCLPSKPFQYKIPLDTLGSFVHRPSSHSLPPRVFGYIAYVHLPKQNRTKLDPQAIKCIFLGYGVNQKGYKCFDPQQNQMYTTMDCEFFEHTYYYSQPGPQGEKVSDDVSWLIYPFVINQDPKEQVGETIDVVTEDTVSPVLTTLIPSNEHATSQEVILEPQQVIDNNPDSIDSNDVPSK